MTAPSETPRHDPMDLVVQYGNELLAMRSTLERTQADLARVTAELDKEERSHEQTITERDNAEDALSQAYFLIIGESPEWSNNFGHNEAIEEIDDAQRLLRESLANAKAERDAVLSDATRWRKHCDVMRRGDVALLVRVLFDITAEQYAATLDSMQEREDG